jgi:hypothetical protein
MPRGDSIFLLVTVGVTPSYASAFNASGGAVLVAIFIHAAFNASSRFLDPFLEDTLTHDHPSAEVFIAVAFLGASQSTSIGLG